MSPDKFVPALTVDCTSLNGGNKAKDLFQFPVIKISPQDQIPHIVFPVLRDG